MNFKTKNMKDHFEKLEEYEYENVTELVTAGTLYKIIDKEIKDDFILFIEQCRKRGDYYIPTDLKITDDMEILVPLTLRSLMGYWGQWTKEKERVEKFSFSIEEKQQSPKSQQLEVNLTDKKRKLIYDLLIKGEFIKEDWESFNYAFGGAMPKTFNKIHWEYSGIALFELLEVLTGTVSNKNIDNCKGLFHNHKGDFNVPRPKSMKPDKREYSPYISKIEEIKAELKKNTD